MIQITSIKPQFLGKDSYTRESVNLPSKSSDTLVYDDSHHYNHPNFWVETIFDSTNVAQTPQIDAFYWPARLYFYTRSGVCLPSFLSLLTPFRWFINVLSLVYQSSNQTFFRVLRMACRWYKIRIDIFQIGKLCWT